MRFILIFILLFFVYRFSHAGMRSPITGQSFNYNSTGGIPSTGTINYITLYNGGSGRSIDTTESNVYNVCGLAGTIDDFQMFLGSVPTGSGTWAFTLVKNGTPTSLSVTLSSSSPAGPTSIGCIGSDTTHSVTIASSDTLSVQSSPSSPTVIPVVLSYSFRFTANNLNQQPLLNTTGNVAQNANTTDYVLIGDSHIGYSYQQYKMIMPTSGTFKNLLFSIGTAPGAGQSDTAFLYKNGVITSLGCTNTGASQTICSDLTNSVSVTTGDTVAIGVNVGVTAANTIHRTSIEWDPTTDGEALWGFPPIQALAGNATRYRNLTYGDQTSQIDEFSRQSPFPASTAKKLITMGTNVTIPVGVGETVTNTLRVNNANTTLTAALTQGTTIQDTTDTVSINDGDLVDIQLVNNTATTPTTGAMVVFTIPSTSNPSNADIIVPCPNITALGCRL